MMINDIVARAHKEIADERAEKIKKVLVAQMRRVQAAREVLADEEGKLEDLKKRYDTEWK